MPAAPLEMLPVRSARPPAESDLAARDVAEAVLVGAEDEADVALARLVALEQARLAAGEAPTDLVPHAMDARNAMLGDGPAWRLATRELLDRNDLDPALRARLERGIQEDPLEVADARKQDAFTRRLARRVNALAEPLGRSIGSLSMLPIRLSQALVGLVVTEHMEDDFSTGDRQALEQWKRFVERHPESPEAVALLERIQQDQQRWYRNQRDKKLRHARLAQRRGDDAMAASLARRALHYAPEDRQAGRMLAESSARMQRRERNRARTLGAPDAMHAGGRNLAIALLLPEGDVAGEARRTLADPDSPHHDEARFALAGAEHRAGNETASWERLEWLEDRGHRSAMARHASALLGSPDQNPHAAFEAALDAERGDGLRFLFLGPLADGARYRDLPRPLEWMLEVPSAPQILTGFPARLLRYPTLESGRRSPGVFARRYLERHPQGEHAEDVRDWLEDHERDRGNWIGAYRVASSRQDADPAELETLRERAADQALDAAHSEEQLDARVGLLMQVARQFEGTRAAATAGSELRHALETTTAQRIGITRGFLEENPEIAGPEGLSLRPELLDDDLDNGELHRDGVALLGGQDIEFHFVHPSGNDERPPETVRGKISEERLRRLVALLQETALENSMLDADDPVHADADRDLFFERASLGLADEAPAQVTARSTYTYRGMRERYGIVRSRESILPIELVLQGSFDDLGLGAFPRIRSPKQTPDAFLYR